MKNLLNILKSFFKRFFTLTNISKIFIIFSIGLLSRYWINEYYNINVFTEYLSWVSITFYSGFAAFIVLIHELFAYFSVTKFPQIGDWNNTTFEYTSEDGNVYTHPAYRNESNRSNNQNRWNIERTPTRVRVTDSNYNNEIMSNSSVNSSNYTIRRRLDYISPNQYLEYSNQIPTNNSSVYELSQDDIARYFSVTKRSSGNVFNTSLYSFENVRDLSPERSLRSPYVVSPTTRALLEDTPQNSQMNLTRSHYTNHNNIRNNDLVSYNNTQVRRPLIPAADFEQVAAPVFYDEIRIPSNSVRGKVSLQVKYIGKKSSSNIQSMWIKYHDVAKRKFMWHIWEQGTGHYRDYRDFKNNFDPKASIWKEIASQIRSDISKEIRDLLNTNPFSANSNNNRLNTRSARRLSYTNTKKN